MSKGFVGQSSKWALVGLFLAVLVFVAKMATHQIPLAQAAEAAKPPADNAKAMNAGAGKSGAKADPKIAERIIANLNQGRPGLSYSEVTTTPVPNLYKVQIERGPLLYVTGDGQYFIAGGEMYTVAPGNFVNLHEEELKPKRVELLAQVKASEQIIFSPEGETKAYVNVFTDVDCGFCRKLHQEVPAMNAKGIEVRYLAYPRAGLQSPSYDKIATAWCSDNPQETLTQLKNREQVPIKVCKDNPIAKQLALGLKVGVQGTPALLLADGSLIPGYVTADELAQTLGLE